MVPFWRQPKLIGREALLYGSRVRHKLCFEQLLKEHQAAVEAGKVSAISPAP